MKTIFSSITFLCLVYQLSANNLQIQNLVYDAVAKTLTFDISWESSFYDENQPYLFDLALLFAKYKNSIDPNWYSLPFTSTGHMVNMPESCTSLSALSSGGAGAARTNIILWNNCTHAGAVAFNITLQLSNEIELVNPSFKVFGLECLYVYVPGEPLEFDIGDGVSANRFHKGDDPAAPFHYDTDIQSSITVGNGAAEINVTSATPLPVSLISASYIRPPSIIMRYEITQQQYVDFLNCLNRTAQNERTGTDISGTDITNRYVMSGSATMINRNGIKCDATLPEGGPVTFYCDYNENDIPNEIDDGQNISANFLSPADLMAYLDWAALKPMNEIQYEFYCRGNAAAVPGEYAWGSTMKTAANLNISASGGPDETPTNVGSDGLFRRSIDPMRTGAAATSTTNRSQAGASYWGIMDLSGNVAEMVIGTYSSSDFLSIDEGDGVLDMFGNANEDDWPTKLVVKGYAPSNVTLSTVSQRLSGSAPYILLNERNSFAGGRGAR